MRLVAIHNRALTTEQIQQNFAAGVGEKYFMLFNVSHLVDVPKAYLMFEASQYDSYSYLFTKPTFISLDPNASVGTIDVAGIRIGVNGAEARVGQSYVPLSTSIGGANYTAGTGQLLSSTGAVIGLEKGPVSDEFFLTFEKIGTHTHAVSEPVVSAPAVVDNDPTLAPEYGLRTFDEINATFARLTGVSITSPTVVSTFANVKQQLPGVESIDSFLASHQTGIAQLAIAYCSAMVDSDALRNQFFGPSVNPNQNVSFFGGANQANRDVVISAIGTNIVGDLGTQPDQTVVYDAINKLLQTIASDADTAARSNGAGIAMKAACAAALGSAAATVQ